MSYDELVVLIHKKYNAAAAKTDDYLVWPDARLRAFLRENGLSEFNGSHTAPVHRPLVFFHRSIFIHGKNKHHTQYA